MVLPLKGHFVFGRTERILRLLVSVPIWTRPPAIIVPQELITSASRALRYRLRLDPNLNAFEM
eukprot:scaffold1199_cov265-Pinguiococcus_pyrenoidosus.AAC.14